MQGFDGLGQGGEDALRMPRGKDHGTGIGMLAMQDRDAALHRGGKFQGIRARKDPGKPGRDFLIQQPREKNLGWLNGGGTVG